jgi:hypothetical protein
MWEHWYCCVARRGCNALHVKLQAALTGTVHPIACFGAAGLLGVAALAELGLRAWLSYRRSTALWASGNVDVHVDSLGPQASRVPASACCGKQCMAAL